mgnify:CR=1 FL=1
MEYPARLDVDYPDRPLSRASTFFRMFMLIPIGIVYALVVGVSFSTGQQGAESGAVGGGILWAPLILMLRPAPPVRMVRPEVHVD